MTLAGKRIVLTGATGGIGSSLAHALSRQNAQLVLVGRNPQRLGQLAAALRETGSTPISVIADLANPDAAAAIAYQARQALGGADILINNAGLGHFRLFEDDDPAAAAALLELNLLAPMRLARALLPEMLARGDGRIVNVGSTFGRLGFPGYSAYSAAKHGLRGWSEALRRELVGSGVSVIYVSPRATETGLNDARATALNQALKTAVDQPEAVARQILRTIEQRRPEAQLGWPEKLLVRLNAVWPGLIDRALAPKLPLIRRCAQTPSSQAARSV